MIVDTDELVTLADISTRSGLAIQSLARWAGNAPSFPPAVKDTTRCRIWLWTDVEHWLLLTGRISPITTNRKE